MKPLNPVAQKQVERRLDQLRSVSEWMKVRPSWLTFMRTALCMPLKSLADAAGFKPPTVKKMEQREAYGKVTLDTMRKLAEAMDCEFVYAIIPKTDLKNLLYTKAQEKAAKLLQEADVHMTLEDQRVKEDLQSRIDILAKSLLEKGDVW